MQGMFRNAHDQLIPKLSLGVQFDQEFMEKTSETSCCKLKRADCMLAIQYFSKDLEEVKKRENASSFFSTSSENPTFPRSGDNN